MVEIEFHGIQPVEHAYQEVMKHINLPPPLPNGWTERNRTLLTKLLSEMAKELGYQLQQLDMLEGGYYPQAFANIDAEQQAVRQQLVAVLSGQRPLLVSQAAPTPPSPFPPPPPPPSPQTGGT